MPPGKMQVYRCRLQIGMAEHHLNAPQVSAGFKKVSCEAVPQGLLMLLMNCTQLGFAIGGIRSMAQKLK